MRINVRSGLRRNLLMLSVLPAMALGVVITVFSSIFVYRLVENEVVKGLQGVAAGVYGSYAAMEGEFYLGSDGNLYKGKVSLKETSFYVDNIKEKTKYDVSVFAEDLRVLTTVVKPDGTSAAGTRTSPGIRQTVLEEGNIYFSADVSVVGKSYFGYYMPIKDEQGNALGMIFAGTPRKQVLEIIWSSVIHYVTIAMCIIAAVAVLSIRYSNTIVENLRTIMIFMKNASEGDITASIDRKLLKRKDEIGEMGRASVILQESLIERISTDSLTGLLNRRSAYINLEHEFASRKAEERDFSIAMGDIDYFKNFNDTHGHECGDVILKELSAVFQQFMKGRGFVARWGGEEFLFVFPHSSGGEAGDCLEALLERIQRGGFFYEDKNLRITMTFGVTQIDFAKTIDKNIKTADDKLYEGKQNGRSQVVRNQ